MTLTPSGKTQLFGKISTLLCYELHMKCDYYNSTRGKVLTPDKFQDYLIAIGGSDEIVTDIILVELGSGCDDKSQICVKEVLAILEIEFEPENVKHFFYMLNSGDPHSITSRLISLKGPKTEPLLNDSNLTKIHHKAYTLISSVISYNSKDYLKQYGIEPNFYDLKVSDDEGQIIKLKDFLEFEPISEVDDQYYEKIELQFYNSLDLREITHSENKDLGLFLVRGVFERLESFKKFATKIEEVLPNTRFYINDISTYEEVCKINKNVHEVVFEEDYAMLNWLRSSKDFSVLREFIIEQEMDNQDDAKENSLKIIHGKETCGKSSMLKKICREIKRNDFSKWVCLLDGPILEKVFETEDGDIERVLSNLLKVKTKVEKAVFSKSISIDHKITLLFDDVDSLPKKAFQNAVRIILSIHKEYPTIQMHVTARDPFRNLLEKNCGIISHEIPELTEEQQTSLLRKLLPPLNADEIKELEMTVQKANRIFFEDSDDDLVCPFRKKPFNLFLIAEMYKNHGLEGSYTKVSVYENYLAWNELHSEDFEKLAYFIFCETEPEMNAVDFPKTDKIFNIDRYMNRSIIEFLVAKHFYYRNPEDLTPDLRELNCMKSIVEIFDRKIFKAFPIMELVFNNNFQEIKKSTIGDRIFDCLNRNPLHLIRDNPKIAKLFLNSNYDVNHKDCFGWTPIRYADHYKDLRMMNFYLENGGREEDLVKINIGPVDHVQRLFPKILNEHCVTLSLYILNNRRDFTVTPYHVFCVATCLETAYDMKDCDKITILNVMATKMTNKEEIYGRRFHGSALNTVIHTENLELVQILVEKFNMKFEDCEIDQITSVDVLRYCLEKCGDKFSEKEKNAIFFRACQRGSIAIIKYFVEELKTDIYLRDDSGMNVMEHVVLWNTNIDIVKCLYDLGFKDFTQLGDENKTCLHSACRGGNLEIIEFLIAHGASLHARTLDNKYPIDFVWKRDFLEIVNSIMGKCSPMMSTDTLNALIVMSSLENVQTYIESYKIDWSIRDSNDYTILQYFVQYGEDLDVLKYIVDHSKVDVRTKDGLTVLHLALQTDKRDMVFNTLQFCCDLNAVTNSGVTCMHFAISGSASFQLAEFLIKKGFDINVRDNKGRTPVHSMFFNSSKELATKSIQFGLNVNARDDDGKTALHHAIEANSYFQLDHIKYCLNDLKVDPSICDNRKRMALHYAVELGKVNVLDTLARYTYLDLDAEDVDGKTPLMLAETIGEECFSFLKEVKTCQNRRD